MDNNEKKAQEIAKKIDGVKEALFFLLSAWMKTAPKAEIIKSLEFNGTVLGKHSPGIGLFHWVEQGHRENAVTLMLSMLLNVDIKSGDLEMIDKMRVLGYEHQELVKEHNSL